MMVPLWFKLVLLGITGAVTIGWWMLAFLAQMMSTTGNAPLPLLHKVVGWVLLGIVGALAWWVFR